LQNQVSRDFYEGVSVEWIHGAVPTAHFFDQEGYEIERATMTDLNEEQISEFFKSHNFLLTRKRSLYVENGKGEWNWGGHHYELFTQRNTLSYAKEFVSSRTYNGLPGYITTLSSVEEQDAIVDMMNRFGVDSVWLDGTDEETEGVWKWVSGEQAGLQFTPTEEGDERQFRSWNEGEPNNAGDEDCLVLLKGKTLNTRNGWNDVNCAEELSALVIEYGTDPHDSSPFSEEVPDSSSSEEVVEPEERKEEL